MRDSGSEGRAASQKTQPALVLGSITYWSRQGDHRWSNGLDRGDVVGQRHETGRRFGRFRLAVDELLQLLARLEVRHLLRRHVDLVARLGVPALPRLALPQAEAAEPAQLDLLPSMQRVDDALEHR